MLDLTERQRSLQVPQLLNEIIREMPGEVVLLDNIEILFDIRLKQDPLRCLQGLARNRTIVVAWNGTITPGEPRHTVLTYAAPDHPEYRRYPAGELVLVSPMVTHEKSS